MYEVEIYFVNPNKFNLILFLNIPKSNAAAGYKLIIIYNIIVFKYQKTQFMYDN